MAQQSVDRDVARERMAVEVEQRLSRYGTDGEFGTVALSTVVTRGTKLASRSADRLSGREE